jgi:hypothetical protein
MLRNSDAKLASLLVLLLLFTPLVTLVSANQSSWAGPAKVIFPITGGDVTHTAFSLPDGEEVLDAWVEVSEDGMLDQGTGVEWVEDANGKLNFSWGLWDSTTANFFDGALSLDANHSVGRINDFETLTRTLQNWNYGGTPGIWEVSDMLGIPGAINGSGRESSGGLIPIGGVTGRYIVATRADQALPNGVHTWMESPDFYVPTVINDFNLTFSHWQHMYTPSASNGDADGAWVEISLDGGSSWRYITPEGGYNNRINSAAPSPNGSGGPNFEVWASPNATGWQSAIFPLDNQPGIANASSVRFRFVAWTDINSTVQRPGWFVDNVNLTNSGDDLGAWFHGNLSSYYADGAESFLQFEVNLSNASGPIMLDYAVDFDMEGDIYDNFRWEWSLSSFTWNAFSADMPGFGVLIGGQMYVDDSRGWKHLSHPLPQSLAGNSTVYFRVYLETDNFPGSGFGGLSFDPPEGLFIDDVRISSGTTGNQSTHLALNFTNINDGNATHNNIGIGIDEWQHLSTHGVNGATYQADSFENSPLLPEGWGIETERGAGWEFRAHNSTWVVGPDAPSSGSYYAGIEFSDLYQPNTWTHLTSSDLAIPAGSHARISFDQFICAETGWDGGVLYVSSDDGRTWVPYGQNEPDFYDTKQMLNVQSDIYNLWAMDGSNSKPTCHGSSSAQVNKSWVNKQVDVSQFGGQTIRLRFSFFTDPLVESDGWYLDNVGLYVDWFEEQGSWTSEPINTNRNGLGTIDVDATVPNGTWVRCTLLHEDGTVVLGMENISFPVIPTVGIFGEKVRIRLDIGTNVPELTPKVHALYVGAVNIFSARDTTNGWIISPLLNVNKTSGNLTNPELTTQSITGPLIYGNNPLQIFELSGVGSGVLITLLDQRGSPFNNGALGNKTVQRTTPLTAYRVLIDIQPGGWLNSFKISGRILQPGTNLSIDIGNDGSVEWQFFEGNDGRGQLGWQDSLMSTNNRSATTDSQWNSSNSPFLLIPDGAIVTGGLVGVQTHQPSVVVNFSIGGTTLLNQQTIQNGLGTMVPLSSTAIQSINNQVALPWLNDNRDWKQVPIQLDTNGQTDVHIYGINYILTDNLTGLGPIIAATMNATVAANGIRDIPVRISADAGGVRLWGGVTHSPLIFNEVVAVPETWLPDRPTIITTKTTHLFSQSGLSIANLTIEASTGDQILFSVSDLSGAAVFSQVGGGGQVIIDTAASSVTSIEDGWEIEWHLQTQWAWDDTNWIDISADSWGINGEHLPPNVVRIGISSNAVENDMEIDSWEVRSQNNRLLSTRGTPLYPFEIADNSTVEVSGTVRFEDSNSRPSGDDFFVAIQVEGDESTYQVAATSGQDGVWNASVTLTATSGSVNLTAWILRPGPAGVSLTGANDVTDDRTPVTLIIDPNPPLLGVLMASTPSGLRPANGNVWPEDRPLPISIEISEIEALGGPLFLHSWREGIDDVNGNNKPDDGEYSIQREITPMKVIGTVRIDFPALDLFANGELGIVSLFVTGTDLAGHSVIGGGGPGIDQDMATLVTQDDLPTTLSLPSITLDRWGTNLLAGITHEFSFKVTDDNGVSSLDNISINFATGDWQGDIWIDPLSEQMWVHDNSPIMPVDLIISELAAGSFEVIIRFRIGMGAPVDWNTSSQHPSIKITEHGQLLELGSNSLSHLAWKLDSRVELVLFEAIDLSPPGSGLIGNTLYLQPDDRFNFSGELRHSANNMNVTLDGNWQVDINMDDNQNEPSIWQIPLSNHHSFTSSTEIPNQRWNRPTATVTASISGGVQTFPIGNLVLNIVIDATPPVVNIPDNTLATINSNQMMQQLVTVRVQEAGGMNDQPLEMHWSFRRHGVEILGMHGVSLIPLATESDGLWTYSSRIDFDIDSTLLKPDDDLVVWVVGTDYAGNSLVGVGSEGDARMPLLRVIFFQPVVSDLLVNPHEPTVESIFVIDGKVMNEGNDMGQVKVGLWTWQGNGDTGRYVLLNETNLTLLPQQHAMFSFNVEAWASGDLQLYIALNDDMTNLTSVPVGLVREQTAGEILFQNLNSPAAIGLLILIVVVAIMVGMVMARKEEDDWDDLDDEVPPPPPWAPDEWPEGAGPPPEILTQSESTLEEE